MHLDQLIFILLIALAGLFRLLTSKSTTRPNQSEPPRRSTTPPRTNHSPPAESDQERIRRFLEALGQPTSSTPPAPIAPRPTYTKPIVLPRAPSIGSPLPPLKTRPPDLPKERPTTLPRQISAAKPPPVTIPPVEPPAFEVHTALSAETPVEVRAETGDSATDLAQLLGSTSALRNAVVLREIFGPPRSLQQFDLIGN